MVRNRTITFASMITQSMLNNLMSIKTRQMNRQHIDSIVGLYHLSAQRKNDSMHQLDVMDRNNNDRLIRQSRSNRCILSPHQNVMNRKTQAQLCREQESEE